MKRRLADLLRIAPGLLALVLLVAFVTYNPNDPSPNVAADGPISNLLGWPGAAVSDVVLRTLGLAGFGLVLVLAGWSRRLMLDHELPKWWLRIALLPVALLALAAVLAALPTPVSWTVEGGLGGFAGVLAMRSLIDLTGLGLTTPAVVCALVGLAALHYTGGLRRTDWQAVAAAFGRLTGRSAERVSGAIQSGRAMNERRKASRAAGAESEAETDEPKPGLAARVSALISQFKSDDAAPADAPRTARREPQLVAGGAGAPEAAPEPEQPAPAKRGRRAPQIDDTPEPPVAEDDEVAAPEPPRKQTQVEPRAPKAQPSKKAAKDDQQRFRFGEDGFELPPLSLLGHVDPEDKGGPSRDALEKNARLLEQVLQDFGVKGEIVKVRPGPVVTRYELEPAPGTKTSRVVGLADDIARSMAAVSVRVAVVPGSSVIGIELPNKQREKVGLRELLSSEEFEKDGGSLPLTLGKDISGNPTIVDLAKMPHLLIAGTTGSGKSVAVNAMLLSLLYRLPPERCRMILIDPKMLELSVYDDIPHLLSPVVTDPKKAVVALKWTVREMEDRYRAMSKLGVRNIAGYNQRVEQARQNGEVLTRKVQTGFDPDTGQPIHEEQPFDLEPLPHIVVVVDEMADLMLVAGKEIEQTVQRLAQMARAAGIHVIMATQRPSVDVITGTIKANFPTRISFHVTSKIDSRTILGETGAEQLLGMGDMLYMAHGGRITRVHGPFVADNEVEEVVAHLKAQAAPDYVEDVTEEDESSGSVLPGSGDSGGDGGENDLYRQAVQVVCHHKKASTSFVQRQLAIGYNRAARLIERMESEGIVSPANHVGKREILDEHASERV
ncbi:DNA translocase FtsK [Rhodovibrio salinarum]|uniref:DNA translocase FtsK n=2 Tax=Rhodovibrio salinarum TaxID=1087 RepID=A0A934QHE6_9PROT|nr:DNA translocase FtsK 4TM domain-containing protein [Rhodovibrio salinarum]MBK1696737.1 DNA translocase FtsK [Rhodovibrio salinarum]